MSKMKPQRSSLSKLRSGSQVRGIQLKNKKNEVNPLTTRTGVRTTKKIEDGQSQVGQSSSPIIGQRRNCTRGRHLVAIDSNLLENEGKKFVKSQLTRNISVATPKTSIRKAATSNSESSRKEALLRRSSRQASRERRVWSKQRLQKRQQLTKSGNSNKDDNAFTSTTTTSIEIIKRKAGRPPKRVLAVDGDKECDKKINVLSKDEYLGKHTDPREKRLGLRTGKLHHRTRGLLRNNPKKILGSPTQSPVITSVKNEVEQKPVGDNEHSLNEELINSNTINPDPDTDVNSDIEEKANITGAISNENAFVFTNTKEEDDTVSDSSLAVSSASAVLDRDGQPSSLLNVVEGSAPKTELKNREQEKFDQDVLLTSLIIRESLQAPSLLTKAISPFSCHEIGSKSLLPGKSMSSGVLSMGSVKSRTTISSVGKSKLRSAISNRMGFTNYLKSKKEKDSVKAVSKIISLRRKQIGIVRDNAAEKSSPPKNDDVCDDSNQQANGTGPSTSRANHKNSIFNRSSTQHPNLGFHRSSLQEVQKIDAASSLLRKFRLNNVKNSAHGRSSKIIDLNALRKRNLTGNSRKKAFAVTMSSVSKPGKAESSDLKKAIVGDAADAAISNIKKDWDDDPSPTKFTMLQNFSNKLEAVKEEACGNNRINAENTHAHGVKFDCPVDYSPDLPISSTISKLQARVQSKNLGGDFQRLGGQSASVAFKNSNLLGKRSDLGFDEEGSAMRKKFKPSSASNSPHQLSASLLPTIDGESSAVPKFQTLPNSPLGVANRLLSEPAEASNKTASPVEANSSNNETKDTSSNSVVTKNHVVELMPSTCASEDVAKNCVLNSTNTKSTALESSVHNLRQVGAAPVCTSALMDSSTVSAHPLERSLGPLSPEALQDGKVSLFAALAQLVEADDDEAGGSDTKQTLTIHPAHKNSTDEELISAGETCDGALPSVTEREAGQAALQDHQCKAKGSKVLIRKDSLPYLYSRLEKDAASEIFPVTVESSIGCSSAVEGDVKKTGVVPWTTKEAGHLGVVEPESSDSSDQSDDEEKENDDCLVSSAAHLQAKKQVPSLIRVPHRPLMIKTPLKCPECPMQFCTVRSLLWHFGIHVSGDSNNNDRVPVLQGLQMPWDRMPAASPAAAVPATVSSEVVNRNNISREGELTVACRRAPLPPCHTPSIVLEERETVARPGRSRAATWRGPHRNFNGEVMDISPSGVPFTAVAADHRQLNVAIGLPIRQNSVLVDGDSSSDVEVLDNDWDRSVQQSEVTRPGKSFSRTPLQSIRGKRNHFARGSGSCTHVGTAKGFEGLRLESKPFKYCPPFNSSTGRGDTSKPDKPRGGRVSSSQGLNVSDPLTSLSAWKRGRKAAAVVFPKGKFCSSQISSSQVITHNTPLFSTSTGVVATVLGTHTIETKVTDNLRPLDLASPIPLAVDQSLTKDRRDKPEKNDVILKIPIPRLNKTSSSSNISVQGPSNQVKEATKFVNIRPKVSPAVASSAAGSGVSVSVMNDGNNKRSGDGGQSALLHRAPPLRSPLSSLDSLPIPLGSLHPHGPAPSLPSSCNTVSIQPLKKLAPTRTIAPFKTIAAKQPTLNKGLASGKGPTSTQTLIPPKNPSTFRSPLYNKKIAPPVVSTLNSSLPISSTYSSFLSGLSKSNFSPHLSQRSKELLSSAGVPLTAVSLPCGASSPMHSVPDHLDTCGNSDGIVMINPSLGLRIVTRSNTSTVDTVTSRPIMSSSIPDTNCLTFVPDSGYNSLTIVPQVGSEPPNKRYNSSPKTPDILTIVPQMDHRQGGAGSPGRRSSLSAPTQIMTAAGKVSAFQAVKLVLLPQQDNVRDKTNCSTAMSPEASTSNFSDQRPPKRTISPVVKSDRKHIDSSAGGISSFRRGGGGQRKSSCTDLEEDDSDDGGMVIDDEKNVDDEQRDGMDPMTLCSVTMEDDSVGPDSGLASLTPNKVAGGRSTYGGRSGLASSTAAVERVTLTNVTSGLGAVVSGQQMRSPQKNSRFSPDVTFQAKSSSECQPQLSDSGRHLPLFTTSSPSLQTSGGYVVSSTAPSSLLTIRCENSNAICRENSEPSSSKGSLTSMSLPLVSLGQPFNYVSKEFMSTASSTCSNVSLTNTNVSLIPSETCSLNNSFCRPLMTNSINTLVSNSNLSMVANSMVPLVNNSILPLITSSSLPVGNNSIVPLASSNNVTLVPSSSIPLVSSPNVLPLLCTSSSNPVPFVSNSRVSLASASNTDYPILFVAPNVPALPTGAISSLSLQNMTSSTVPSSSAVNTSTVVFTSSINVSPPCSASSRASLSPGDQGSVVASAVSCVELADKSSACASSSPKVSCAAQTSSAAANCGADQSCRSHSEDSPSLPEKEGKSGEVSPENVGGGRQPAPADRSKYESRKYVCQFCGRRFGWSTDLKRHVILHTGEKPFKCGVCGTAFTRKFLLQNHMKRMHLDECNASDLWSGEK